jgi:hypothetical protein
MIYDHTNIAYTITRFISASPFFVLAFWRALRVYFIFAASLENLLENLLENPFLSFFLHAIRRRRRVFFCPM